MKFNLKFYTMTTKEKFDLICNDHTFKTYFKDTGENLDEALEIWLEHNGDLVEVYSAEDAVKLEIDISKLDL